MAKKTKEYQDITNHISRLEGQIASVKRELGKTDPDCAKASRTLAAASRSFASLRRSFVECFLGKKYIKPVSSKKQVSEYETLLNIINS
ncbi:MAG: metal-sensing transcriptional repressor [Patescibacteria group bacterium UBA2163]